MDAATEDHRRACEARDWLRQGYRTEKDVDALMVRIRAKRGQDAADALRSEMREQWRRRRSWWSGAPA